MDPTKYTMTSDEAAKLLGVSGGMLRQMRFKGTGPNFYKPGGRTVLYCREEVLEWARGRVRDASKVA